MQKRLITTVVGLALLFLVLMFFDTVFFNLVFVAVAMLGVFEAYKAFSLGQKHILLYAMFLPVVLLLMLGTPSFTATWGRPLFYVFILFFAVYLVFNSETLSVQKAGGYLLLSGVVIYCFYAIIRLKNTLPVAEYGNDAIYFILLILSFAWGGDSAAYMVGRRFGKRKLAPHVSPNKTVEGAVGGMLGSVLVSMVVTTLYVYVFKGFGTRIPSVHVTYYGLLLLLGALASMLGMFGDLFASAIKRQCNIKDYGSIFPGHGGILDRFDSVMFIAPLVSMLVTQAFYSMHLPVAG